MTATGTPIPAARHVVDAPRWGWSRDPGRATEASWITGPSIIGSEKGMPTSMASAPAADHRLDDLDPVVGHPAHDVGDQQLAARRPAGPQRSLQGPGTASPAHGGRPRPQQVADLGHVLVAAPRQGHQHGRARRDRPAGLAGHPGQGVGRLEGGDDPLGLGQQPEGGQHLVVVGRLVGGPADRGQVGVLGADARVVEAGRDGLRLEDLTALVLEELGAHPVEDAGDARRSPPPRRPPPPRPAGRSVSTNPAKVPAALEPPPTQATTRSGSAPPSSCAALAPGPPRPPPAGTRAPCRGRGGAPSPSPRQ